MVGRATLGAVYHLVAGLEGVLVKGAYQALLYGLRSLADNVRG